MILEVFSNLNNSMIMMFLGMVLGMTGIFILFCFPGKDISLHAVIANDVK